MKKGFTMIELIFVIVILGILAAVAIPRLAATRDDAEVSKAATNLTTIASDIGSYYTGQGRLAPNITDMTNVQIAGNGLQGTLTVAGENCFTLTLTPAVTTVGSQMPARLQVANVANPTRNACIAAQANPSITRMVNATFSYSTIDAQGVATSHDDGVGIAISGTGVVF